MLFTSIIEMTKISKVMLGYDPVSSIQAQELKLLTFLTENLPRVLLLKQYRILIYITVIFSGTMDHPLRFDNIGYVRWLTTSLSKWGKIHPLCEWNPLSVCGSCADIHFWIAFSGSTTCLIPCTGIIVISQVAAVVDWTFNRLSPL